jgi:mobilization protein NikA
MTRRHAGRVPRSRSIASRGERRQIDANANAAGLSLSTYLLNVGIGYEIRSIVDHKQVEELARINGDLGRLEAC